MRMALEISYTDSPTPWRVVLPVIAAVILAVLFVAKRNRGSAKVVIIVLVAMALGSLAIEAITALAFDCDETSDRSETCRLRF